jgi:hypothetical protein
MSPARVRWAVALGIFAITCAAFAPAVRGGFIMIDDPVYVVGARVPAPPFAPLHAWVTMRL